jgi:hypothetical protein
MVIENSPDVELTSRNQHGQEFWLHSPANMELFAVTYRRLLDVAKLRKLDTREIAYIRAARVSGTDLTFVYPTTDKDPNRIPLTKYSAHYWGNLRTLLEPAGRLVEVGYRKRYAMELIPDSPVGPALVFDFDRPLESRQEPKAKKGSGKKAGAAKQPAAAAPAQSAPVQAAPAQPAPAQPAPAEAKQPAADAAPGQSGQNSAPAGA